MKNYKLIMTDIKSNGNDWYWVPKTADRLPLEIYDEQQQEVVEWTEQIGPVEYLATLLRTAQFHNDGFTFKWKLMDWTEADDMMDADDSVDKQYPIAYCNEHCFTKLYEEYGADCEDVRATKQHPDSIAIKVTAAELMAYDLNIEHLAHDRLQHYLPIVFSIHY